jgi:hypothetical protein
MEMMELKEPRYFIVPLLRELRTSNWASCGAGFISDP